jgi:quinoprotein glucose dehydrogenase
MTVDVERGLLFLPIGTPTPDFYGASRKGSNLYGSSLVAVDAATGKLKWHFQTTHHDNWDYDLTSAPALIDVMQDGKSIPAVAQWTPGTRFLQSPHGGTDLQNRGARGRLG